MNLLEKKKIVAKWMGWDVNPKFLNLGVAYSRNKNDGFTMIKHWKPDEDRNCWPELWDNMSAAIMDDYVDLMYITWRSDKKAQQRWTYWLLTAKTSLHLDGLVKTIQQSGEL